jgi:hypothetical protein
MLMKTMDLERMEWEASKGHPDSRPEETLADAAGFYSS